MSVEAHAISELLLQLLPEMVAQSAHPFHRREIARKRAGLAETDRKQCTLGTRPPATFVSGTVNQRLERHATANEQGADALGRIDLVAGNREKIDAEFVDVRWNLADGLGRIGVKQDAVLVGNASAILDRLDGADLVVGVHDADEDRARRDRFAKVVGVNPAGADQRASRSPARQGAREIGKVQ